MSSSLPVIVRAVNINSFSSLRNLLCNSVVSRHTQRAYAKAFDDFIALAAANGRPVCRAMLMEYRSQMIDQGLGMSTINVRLSAIRKLLKEARDNFLIDPVEAERIISVSGVPEQGVRLGH
jgi:site-specific recombinase XerC